MGIEGRERGAFGAQRPGSESERRGFPLPAQTKTFQTKNNIHLKKWHQEFFQRLLLGWREK